MPTIQYQKDVLIDQSRKILRTWLRFASRERIAMLFTRVIYLWFITLPLADLKRRTHWLPTMMGTSYREEWERNHE